VGAGASPLNTPLQLCVYGQCVLTMPSIFTKQAIIALALTFDEGLTYIGLYVLLYACDGMVFAQFAGVICDSVGHAEFHFT